MRTGLCASTSGSKAARAAFRLLLAGYGFLAALAVMLVKPAPAGVVLLCLQCVCVVFAVPACCIWRPAAGRWPGRAKAPLMQMRQAVWLVGAGAAGGGLGSLASAPPDAGILTGSAFALSFAVFLAGTCFLAGAAFGRTAAQVLTIGIGLLMVSTPYYVNPLILLSSGALRMRVVQAAVNVNPLLVGAAGIMNFDWLRAGALYHTCLIGGYQYPFYYPGALKVGIIFGIAGMIFMMASTLRKG